MRQDDCNLRNGRRRFRKQLFPNTPWRLPDAAIESPRGHGKAGETKGHRHGASIHNFLLTLS
jgi:hypothetical protein